MNIIVNESELLKEFGSNSIQGKENLTGMQKLEQQARKIMEEQKISYPKAMTMALKENPDYYDEYNKNK